MSQSASSTATRTMPGMLSGRPARRDSTALDGLLKRCPASTLAAARSFRRTRRLDLIPAIVGGVIGRHVDDARGEMLRTPAGTLRLAEDLGIDSLSMIEISMTLEDVLEVSVPDDTLRQTRTWGELIRTIEQAVGNGSDRH